jgi:hypothetical protein
MVMIMKWNEKKKEEIKRIEKALKTFAKDKGTEEVKIKIDRERIKMEYRKDGMKFFVTMDVTMNVVLPSKMP